MRTEIDFREVNDREASAYAADLQVSFYENRFGFHAVEYWPGDDVLEQAIVDLTPAQARELITFLESHLDDE